MQMYGILGILVHFLKTDITLVCMVNMKQQFAANWVSLA